MQALAFVGILLLSTSTAISSDLGADLLIVGGTESGCAAAVQAARMGVKRITIVNDIEWLGGQFSAEGLGAIDENRAHRYNGKVPIPRSGIFRDVIDAIEAKNAALYGGIRRPGNTRVITTSRPMVSEQVFRELLAPFEATGQIKRYSNFDVDDVLTKDNRVMGVRFKSSTDGKTLLTVRTPMTIDASDWGDVIQTSGAEWDAGVDAKSEFDEPSAPDKAEPATDMNPITWCMILEERPDESLFPQPTGYDPRYFNGQWGWMNEEFAYTTRRLIDGHGFTEIDHPDILLINSPPIDYPLDVYPASVAAELEATELGASKKTIVAMSPAQRAIVFRDARKHSLKYYYHLQQRFPKFHRLALSNEFGTADKLPPKPYIRESLRLVAQHIITEQEVLGFESRSDYATTMFHDAVFSWQFEMDFHPTKRKWTTEDGENGPWEATFRGKRKFGRGGTGRAVFPVRSLVPRRVKGLLSAQKNLGYTSIVGSSCRLHDQSIHAGQASGATAAVCLRHNIDPAELYLRRGLISEIQQGLLEVEGGAPLAIWPFSDVDPFDPCFIAVQKLALHRMLGLSASDISFQPEGVASNDWYDNLLGNLDRAGYLTGRIAEWSEGKTRGDVAIEVCNATLDQQQIPLAPVPTDDADHDGINNAEDPLPFTAGHVSWKRDPRKDGRPDFKPPFAEGVRAFNFTSASGPQLDGYMNDIGRKFQQATGFGWKRDLAANTRLRDRDEQPLRNGFVFTRQQDIWECVVPNGVWQVHASLGDAGHEQPGQHLKVEGKSVVSNVNTHAGQHHEVQAVADVADGRLTLMLGVTEGGSNTCINWLIIVPAAQTTPRK